MSVWTIVLDLVQKDKVAGGDVDILINSTIGAFYALKTGKYETALQYLEKEVPSVIKVLETIAMFVFPGASFTIEIGALIFTMLIQAAELGWAQRQLLEKLVLDVEEEFKHLFTPWIKGNKSVILHPVKDQGPDFDWHTGP